MTQSATDRPLLIGLMGATGTGKSTFANLMSQKESLTVGHDLISCTQQVALTESFTIQGQQVKLIDTPGFDDTLRKDSDILKEISSFLAATYEQGITLAGIIYLHRITDYRVGGISSRNFRMFRKLCGDESLKNVVIVTNMWSEVQKDIGEAREVQLRGDSVLFKPVLDRGAQMMRHDGTYESGCNILEYFLHTNPHVLQIQRELVDEKKSIVETAACQLLDAAIAELKRKHEEEMYEMRREFEQAMKEKDLAAAKEVEEARAQLMSEMESIEQKRQELEGDFEKEKTRYHQEFSILAAELEKQKAEQDELIANAKKHEEELIRQRDSLKKEFDKLQVEADRKQREAEERHAKAIQEERARQEEMRRKREAEGREERVGSAKRYEEKAKKAQNLAERLEAREERRKEVERERAKEKAAVEKAQRLDREAMAALLQAKEAEVNRLRMQVENMADELEERLAMVEEKLSSYSG
ncbi:P-loop containing nucleoside triphosphate hydrolase protein [Abortiporus biennis]|nr:P-loop containing nucleoside triphosphate hydrolase protein [Abortiporus biennis]